MKKIIIEDLTKKSLIELLKSAWENGSAVGDPECLPEAKESQDYWFKMLGLIED